MINLNNSLLRSMRDAGNLPASGYYDQLLVLKGDFDSLKTKIRQPVSESDGLQMLLAASGSQMSRSPNTTAFGVGDAGGAVLDDPFLQEFMQMPQPYVSFGVGLGEFDPVSGLPVGQLQFDWENANLFGNL